MSTISKRTLLALSALTFGTLALASSSSGGAGSEGGSDQGSENTDSTPETFTVLSADELGGIIEGLGFEMLPQDQVEQAAAGVSSTSYDSIEPAACEEVLVTSSLLTDDASAAIGTSQAEQMTAAAFSYPDSAMIDEAFSMYNADTIAACPEYTATTQGMEITGTIEVIDVTVDGADEAIGIAETASLSGSEVTSTRVLASKGGVLVNVMSMAGDADAATSTATEVVGELP